MNYKNIIKNQDLRIKILGLTKFIPDKIMIKLQYKISTGRNLNLKNPKRFTEKLQWYKLYYRDPLMTICADKYEVRKYVKEKGYEDILVPLLGVYENSNEIDFDKMPNRFVLKTTNGSHTNIFCENKKEFNFEKTKITLDKWLKRDTISPGREWAYHGIKPKIICEDFIEKDENNDLIDYKFFCFNGKVYCMYVIIERFLNEGIKLGIYDKEFNKLSYRRADINPIEKNIDKPQNFEKMIEIAEALGKDFPHVRVDLYNIKGKIIFGELTFYDGSGYNGFISDEFDFILGERFIIKK